MSSSSVALIIECKRLSEGCLYTSTSLFVWLRYLRRVKIGFVVVPLVLGSLASWSLLTTSDLHSIKLLTAIFAFVAGLLPTVYAALKFDDHLNEAQYLAGEYKNLQDRFRQAALVSSKKPFEEFEKEVQPVIERLERARGQSITPPEWCYRRAKTKVKAGDYNFDVDLLGESSESSPEG